MIFRLVSRERKKRGKILEKGKGSVERWGSVEIGGCLEKTIVNRSELVRVIVIINNGIFKLDRYYVLRIFKKE